MWAGGLATHPMRPVSSRMDWYRDFPDRNDEGLMCGGGPWGVGMHGGFGVS